MIEGLDYAISVLKRGAARHDYYASGDFTKADKNVKFGHFKQSQACLDAVTLLKRKRASYIKESAPSASSNSRYESAMDVFEEWVDYVADGVVISFQVWLKQRLHSAKAPNVS